MELVLTIQKDFKEAYNDPTSNEYKELENAVVACVSLIAKLSMNAVNDSCFIGLNVSCDIAI